MKYKILLFDADETLLDFSGAEYAALKETFSYCSIEPSDMLCRKFSEINNNLWKLFEKKQIRKSDIIKRRFKESLAFFNIPYSTDMGLEAYYQNALSNQHGLIEYAEETVKKLCSSYNMYIITNGLLSTQTKRLYESGIMKYFKDFFVSESIGFQKPSKEYFENVLNKIGNPVKSEVLIIGDSCSSDINGGILTGIDTCWFNPKHLPMTAISEPTYKISDLREIFDILNK